MNSQIYEFNVEMTCEGCSSAVKRVLGKKIGVDNINIDLANKKVFVTSSLPNEEILDILKKTGKSVSYIGTQN